MSTRQTYTAVSLQRRTFQTHAVVENQTGQTVDLMRTATGADYAARMLNVGACTIDRHAVIGARIVPARTMRQSA